jgi:hypothetical protein
MYSTKSSLTPPHDATETLTVDLAAIRQDATWPVDPDLVSSFRASIRRGAEPRISSGSVNRSPDHLRGARGSRAGRMSRSGRA